MRFNKLFLCPVLALAGAVAAPAQDLFRIMNLELDTVWTLVPKVRPASAIVQRFQAGRPQGMAEGFASEPALTLWGGELLEFRQAGAGATPALAFECHDFVSGRRFTLAEPSGPAGAAVAGVARWDGATRTWYLDSAAAPAGRAQQDVTLAGSAQQAVTPAGSVQQAAPPVGSVQQAAPPTGSAQQPAASGSQAAPSPATAAAHAVQRAKERASAEFEAQKAWGLAWVDREVRRVLAKEAEAIQSRLILEDGGRPTTLPRPISLASVVTYLPPSEAFADTAPVASAPASQPPYFPASLPVSGAGLTAAAEPRLESKADAQQSGAGGHSGKRARTTFEQGQVIEDPRPWKRAKSEEPASAPEPYEPGPDLPGTASGPGSLGLEPAVAATDLFNPTTSQTIVNNDDRDWLLLMPKLDRVLEIHRFPRLRGQARKGGKAPREFLDPAHAWTTLIEANSIVRFLIPTGADGGNLDFGLACAADAGEALSHYVPFRWTVDGTASRARPLWVPGSAGLGPWHARCSVDPGSLSITLAPAGAGAGRAPASAGDGGPGSFLTMDAAGSEKAR